MPRELPLKAVLVLLTVSGTVLLTESSAHGQFTAAPGSPFPAGTLPGFVAAADFNGDGKLDLAIANFGSNNVTILLGNGSGGFSAAPGSPFAVGASPMSLAVGDFNRDGKPDLAIASSAGNSVAVFLGTGTGRFNSAPGSPFPVGASPSSVVSGDFNGDGRPDFATANSGDGTFTVFLGNGSGGFTAAPGSPFGTGTAPQALAVGDVNSDGRQDLVAVSLSGNNVTVLLGNGAGGFSPAPNSPFAVGLAPMSIAVRDLNGDGKPDIVTANSGDNTVTELVGDGTGSFIPSAGSPFPVGTKPSAVAVSDVNGDGIPDVLTVNRASGNLTVLLGNTAGGFSAASGSPFGLGTTPLALAVGDFNGDGKPDTAAVNSGDGAITVYLNSLPALTADPASLTFYAAASIPVAITSPTSGSTYNVTSSQPWLSVSPASNATGGSTKVSLSASEASLTPGLYTGVVRYAAPGWFAAATNVTLSVASPSGTLQPAPSGPFAVGAGPQSVVVADFNGDGNPDILTANDSDSTVSLLLGNGSGGFASAPGGPFPTGASPNSAAVGDIDGDGKPDIVTANSGDNSVTVLLGDGAGGFTQAAGSPFAVGKEPLSVALADFNGDGNLDMVVANNVDKNVTILLGNGAGGFLPAAGSPIGLGTAPQAVTIGDFNGDGIPDIAAAAFNNRVTILIGNGTGGFAVAKSFAVGSFPQFVATADVNADGKLDIVTANFGNNNVSVLLGDGTGGFTAAKGSPFSVGMLPQSFTLADVNGDGIPDIVSANTGDNTISLLLGDGTGNFAPAAGSPFAAGTAPYAVAAGDFNGDGRPDIAAADVVGSVTVLLGSAVATSAVLSTTAGANLAYGTPVPLTLKLTSGGFATPTGAATFLDSGVALGTATQQTSPYTYNAVGLTPGTHTLTASYAGDSGSLASTSNTVSVTVAAASQTISFGALANKTFGAAPFIVTATASSGLPVSLASTTPAVCTVSGATVTLVGGGTCTLQATQPGDADYAPAVPVSQHFTVAAASQTISFAALPNVAIGTPPLTLDATASSGLTVSFAASPASVCTVSGTTLTLVGAGTCTIQATQPGNASYTAAPGVSQHFTVTPTGQTIAFGPLSDQTFSPSPVTLTATATSGLAVTFASSTAPVCTVSGTSVTLVSVGVCTVKATQAGNSSFAAAPAVSQSFNVTQGAQTITFGALSNKAIGSPHFTVMATASSGLAVIFVSNTAPVCTVSGGSVTLVGVGSCTVEAQQAGNANYAAAPPVDQTFQVTPGNQTIVFGALATKAFGSASFTVSATASSGLAVAFASTTPAVCTVSGASVTLVSVGTCTVEASQAGNAGYNAATPVDQSFSVTQGSQTITFAALTSQPFGSPPIALTATASSGLPVSFAASPATVCTVAGAAVTVVGLGNCNIQATQAGNANYTAAPSVSQKFSVTQATQAITFAAIPNQTVGAAPLTLNPTSTSGLTVALTSTTLPVCSVSGFVVTLVSAGTCTLQAAQAGNANFAAAPSVSQSFTVSPASQTISFAALASRPLGPPFTVTATASSGLAVSFASTTAAICTVAGATVTLVSAGTCTVEASQPGNSNYAAAAPVDQSFAVTPATQTITFGSLANIPFTVTPIPLSATATSGLPVSFTSLTAPVCTVSGSNLTLVGTGNCTVQAAQAGNANWPAAAPVNQSFTVTFGTQTLTFGPLANQTFGAAPFALTATASSGLTVSYVAPTPSVCTVSGVTVTLISVGTCAIGALQTGNANFGAAPPVLQSFMVTQASQTITFGPLSNQPFGAVVPLGASASSGLAVAFTASPSSVCAISGANVTPTGVGTCNITATQPGNTNYAAATPVTQSFTISQGSQTISLSALPNQGFTTAPLPVSAVASSGLPVTIASTTTPVCTVSPGSLTLLGIGTCTISAAQAGNANYAAAPTVSASFLVTPGNQSISFAPLPNLPAGAAPFAVSAIASSGLPVAFASVTPAVCTVAGATVTLLTTGTCTLQATQVGNALYAAAPPAAQSFTVTAAMSIGAVLNAASYAPVPLASLGYTVVFGNNLAAATAETPSVNLPITLGGATVSITDSTGQTLTSPLYYVSPTQINFLVPNGLAAGKATVTVAQPAGSASFVTTVANVSPAIFTADSSGQGVPAAIAFDFTAGAETQGPPVYSCGGTPVVCAATPIDLGPASTKVYLVLFGTGIRGRSSLAGVSVTVGGISLEVDYAGAQETYPGLDQVNVVLDRGLIGRGQMVLQLTVDGVAANPVTVNVR